MVIMCVVFSVLSAEVNISLFYCTLYLRYSVRSFCVGSRAFLINANILSVRVTQNPTSCVRKVAYEFTNVRIGPQH